MRLIACIFIFLIGCSQSETPNLSYNTHVTYYDTGVVHTVRHHEVGGYTDSTQEASEYTEYYPTGSIKLEMEPIYINNTFYGIMREYSPAGTIIKETLYYKGNKQKVLYNRNAEKEWNVTFFMNLCTEHSRSGDLDYIGPIDDTHCVEF